LAPGQKQLKSIARRPELSKPSTEIIDNLSTSAPSTSSTRQPKSKRTTTTTATTTIAISNRQIPLTHPTSFLSNHSTAFQSFSLVIAAVVVVQLSTAQCKS
jgi:hypothetical protein